VLFKALLLSQIARPVPWTTPLEANREEHGDDRTRWGLDRGFATVKGC
jgi:hypothetical protein